MKKARLEEFVDEMYDFIREYSAIRELNVKSDYDFLVAKDETGVFHYDLRRLPSIVEGEDPYYDELSIAEFLVGSNSKDAKELAKAKVRAIAQKVTDKDVVDYTYSREGFMMALAMSSSIKELAAEIRQFLEFEIEHEYSDAAIDDIYDAVIKSGDRIYFNRKLKELIAAVDKAAKDLSEQLEDKPDEEKRILRKNVKVLKELKTALSEYELDEKQELKVNLDKEEVESALEISDIFDVDIIVKNVIEKGFKYSYTIEDFVEYVVAHFGNTNTYLTEKDVEAITERLISICTVWSKVVNFKGIPYSAKSITNYVRYLKNADYMYGDIVPLFDEEKCMSDEERADLEAARLTIKEKKAKRKSLTFPKQKKDEE